MDIPKEVEQKIVQLQMMEQHLQSSLLQKQNFQTQLLEIENALKEIESTKGQVYKVVGGIMVSSDKKSLKEELTAKKEIIDLRVKSLKKQEETIKEKAEKLQAEIVGDFKAKK